MRSLYKLYLLGFLVIFASGNVLAMPDKSTLNTTNFTPTQAVPENRRRKKQKQTKTLWQKLKWSVITTTILTAIIVIARLLNKPKPQRGPTPPPAATAAADATCSFCAGDGFAMVDEAIVNCQSCALAPTEQQAPGAAQMPQAAACEICTGQGLIFRLGYPNEPCPLGCPQRPTTPRTEQDLDAIKQRNAQIEASRKTKEEQEARIAEVEKKDRESIQREKEAAQKEAQDLLEIEHEHAARQRIEHEYTNEYTQLQQQFSNEYALFQQRISHAFFLFRHPKREASAAAPIKASATSPTPAPAPAPRTAEEETAAAERTARAKAQQEQLRVECEKEQLENAIRTTQALLARQRDVLATTNDELKRTQKPTKEFAKKILLECIDAAERNLSEQGKAIVLVNFNEMNKEIFSKWLQKNAPEVFTAWNKELQTTQERWSELKKQQQQFTAAIQSKEKILASLQTEVGVKHE